MMESWISSFYLLLERWGYPHPLHPAVVHFPIGMVMGSFIFGWLAVIFKKEQLSRSARHCLVVAFLFWFPVVLLGFADWQYFYKGAWLEPIKFKLSLAGILFGLLLIALILNFRKEKAPKTILAIYTLALFNMVLLGFWGGQLVYGKAQERPSGFEPGKKIFYAHCQVCHPKGGNVLKPDHPIINSPKLKNPDTFTAWIRNPIPPMPRFPESEISGKEAGALYDFLSNELGRSK